MQKLYMDWVLDRSKAIIVNFVGVCVCVFKLTFQGYILKYL